MKENQINRYIIIFFLFKRNYNKTYQPCWDIYIQKVKLFIKRLIRLNNLSTNKRV